MVGSNDELKLVELKKMFVEELRMSDWQQIRWKIGILGNRE